MRGVLNPKKYPQYDGLDKYVVSHKDFNNMTGLNYSEEEFITKFLAQAPGPLNPQVLANGGYGRDQNQIMQFHLGTKIARIQGRKFPLKITAPIDIRDDNKGRKALTKKEYEKLATYVVDFEKINLYCEKDDNDNPKYSTQEEFARKFLAYAPGELKLNDSGRISGGYGTYAQKYHKTKVDRFGGLLRRSSTSGSENGEFNPYFSSRGGILSGNQLGDTGRLSTSSLSTRLSGLNIRGSKRQQPMQQPDAYGNSSSTYGKRSIW
jgi:hypothetical protein